MDDVFDIIRGITWALTRQGSFNEKPMMESVGLNVFHQRHSSSVSLSQLLLIEGLSLTAAHTSDETLQTGEESQHYFLPFVPVSSFNLVA